MKKIAKLLLCTSAIFCSGICGAADMETVAVIGTGDMGDSVGPVLA